MVDCLKDYIIPIAVPIISVALTSISTFIILKNYEFKQWYAQPFIAKKLEAYIYLDNSLEEITQIISYLKEGKHDNDKEIESLINKFFNKIDLCIMFSGLSRNSKKFAWVKDKKLSPEELIEKAYAEKHFGEFIGAKSLLLKILENKEINWDEEAKNKNIEFLDATEFLRRIQNAKNKLHIYLLKEISPDEMPVFSKEQKVKEYKNNKIFKERKFKREKIKMRRLGFATFYCLLTILLLCSVGFNLPINLILKWVLIILSISAATNYISQFIETNIQRKLQETNLKLADAQIKIQELNEKLEVKEQK